LLRQETEWSNITRLSRFEKSILLQFTNELSMKNLCTLLTLVLCLVFTQSALAVVTPTKTADVKTEVVEKEMTKKETRELKKQARKMERMQKRMAKFEKKMEKRQARGGDDTKKWMKFWLLGWGAGLLLYIIAVAAIGSGGTGFGLFGALTLIGSLAWLFGSVSLIIWLVKKFS